MTQLRQVLTVNRIVLVFLMISLVGGVRLWQPVQGAPAPLHALQWEEPKHLSTSSTGAFRPVLRVAPNGRMMIAYNNKVSGDVQNPFYVVSDDAGVTWSAPRRIRNSSADLRLVTLAFDPSNQAHAVWRTPTGLAHAAESAWPNGASNSVHSSSYVILDPFLAIGSDGVLHLVWAGAVENAGLHNIYYSYSSNNGADWSDPKPLATTTRHSSAPVVAVDASNNVHVVWEERIIDTTTATFGLYNYQTHYKKGTKSGSNYTWSANPTTVSGTVNNARRPFMLADGNVLHVSFAREDSNDAQYPYYTAYVPGSGWSAPIDVSRDNPVAVNTNSPFYLITTMTKCSDHIYIYYHGAEVRNAKEQLFGVSSVDDWAGVDIATSNTDRSVNPSLACTGGTLHLAFGRIHQASVNHQTYYTVSRNINQIFLPLIFRP